jgi:hypothetical protein
VGAFWLLGCGGKASDVAGGRGLEGSGGSATVPAGAGAMMSSNGSSSSVGNSGALPHTGSPPVTGTGGTSLGTPGDASIDGGARGTGGAPVTDGAAPDDADAAAPHDGSFVGANGRPTALPQATDCPVMSASGSYEFGRLSAFVQIAPDARTKPGGPLILYFHGTASSPTGELPAALGQSAIDEVVGRGGVVAALVAAPCDTCTATGPNVWFVEDDLVVDQIVACAIQQASIDTRHIHLLGFGSGAIHVAHLAIARSSYVASFISHLGGLIKWDFDKTPRDPTNHVASILVYRQDQDNFISSYVMSRDWYNTYGTMGYYTMMCEGAGRFGIDRDVAPHTLRFFDEHPYKVHPEPYAKSIPPEYPTYCKNEL